MLVKHMTPLPELYDLGLDMKDACTEVISCTVKYLCSTFHENLQGVAIKFAEWCYFKPHTCVLTAYWEGSPSKYSPWTGMYLR
jgi:hypothetical protein